MGEAALVAGSESQLVTLAKDVLIGVRMRAGLLILR